MSPRGRPARTRDELLLILEEGPATYRMIQERTGWSRGKLGSVLDRAKKDRLIMWDKEPGSRARTWFLIS